ncbi:MAG: TauD/TfdA family dioxygenase [Kiloniellales bacterium]|nr:TauD/TfdA family dioxygenase [Kiloniellales bacterium]
MPEDASTYRRITVQPVSGALGAEIDGVDLAEPLDERQAAEIDRAFAAHKVIFFRDQKLTPEQQIAFSARFGVPERMPFIAPHPDHPEIIVVLKEADEAKISTFGGTWHSDFSFLPEPPAATCLYALEVPETGGDTLWIDMALAFETLSPGLQALLEGMKAMHTAAPYYGTRNEALSNFRLSRSMRIDRDNPEADFETAHPVVLRHPVTGRKALFVNPVYALRFEDMTREESKPLLDFLQGHATKPEFSCRFRWAPGSLALWDNRVTQHLAINDYDGQRRLLHRTTIGGQKPQAAAD